MPKKTQAKSKKYDLISIGDCVIDAFIRVEEATLHKFKPEDNEICFRFGDKLPYKSLHMLTAGNSNNAAIGASRLGLKTAFYATVGDDNNGKLILNRLKKEGVDTVFMKTQNKLPTNFHFVLWFQKDRTILIKHQPFQYALPKGIENTRWIYLSSIGPKGLQLNPAIVKMLNAHTEMKMAFNPGTFQLRMGAKKLGPLFKRTEILFVNKEEAEQLVGKIAPYKELAEKLHFMGPKTVVITDGLKGSFCYDSGTLYTVGIYPHKPIEATGCGDAYASGFTSARAHGLSVPEALRWAARNGAGVATKIGPQDGLITEREMKRDLNKHPNLKATVVQGKSFEIKTKLKY
jgi:sugar/nucleoside kinase (ribokinase family)